MSRISKAASTHGKMPVLTFDRDRALNKAEVQRYSRHLLIPEVGERGQGKLLDAKVLAHRRGRIGQSNGALPGRDGQWDARHCRCRCRGCHQFATPSPCTARPISVASKPFRLTRRSKRSTRVAMWCPHTDYLTSDNIMDVLPKYDIIVNGCDNFPTRYLVNDACVFLKKNHRGWQHFPV